MGYPIIKRIALIVFMTCMSTYAFGDIKRPLVFIPGIAGSELQLDGETVWGTLSSLENLDQLYIDSGPREPDDTLKAKNIISGISFLGIEFKKQYSPLTDYLTSTLGYTEGKDLFLFPYDWRRSNTVNSAKLKEFIEQNGLKASDGFDILAHSMGGIIAKLYLLDYSDDHGVENFITMGTPFYGSVQMLDTIVQGWGSISFFAGGSDRVREILLSFPSVYELLPHYDLCCVWGTRQPDDRVSFDITDVRFWKAGNWFGKSESEWIGPLSETLANARKVHEALSQPLPENVSFWTISGTSHLTKFQVYIDPENITKPASAVHSYTFTDGDGTVTRPIASYGQIAQSFPSWNKHGTVFNDTTAESKLRDILLREGSISPDNISNQSINITSTNSRSMQASQVHIAFDKVQYSVGEKSVIELAVMSPAESIDSNDKVRVRLNSPKGTSFHDLDFQGKRDIHFFDHVSQETLSKSILVFKTQLDNLEHAGLLVVSIADANGGDYSDDAIVINR